MHPAAVVYRRCGKARATLRDDFPQITEARTGSVLLD
jgi:hypothetical protein